MGIFNSFLAILLLWLPAVGSLAATASLKGPKPVLSIPWGSGPGQAGKLERKEGESEGPASFAVSATGELYLLDQVNARVLKFSPAGRLVATIPIPVSKPECQEGASFEDIVLAPDGNLLLLDVFVLQSVFILDQTGKEVNRYHFSQFGIKTRVGDQIIGKTMLFLPDGLYLEHVSPETYESRWFRPLDQSLRLVKYDRYTGFPFKSGKELLRIKTTYDGKKRKSFIILSRQKKDFTEVVKNISVPHHVSGIPLFTFDQQNRIYLIYNNINEDNPKKPVDLGYTGIIFAENFRELSRFRYRPPANELDLYCEHHWKVGQNGKVYYLSFLPEGVRILCWE